VFSIFHGETLIGRSELESGDPPMGIASGVFEPAAAFADLRKGMKTARDGTGKEQNDIRFLTGLRATTAKGVPLVGANVEVFEYGDESEPFAWEVFCVGVEQPSYQELFPHHVKAYEDQFKD
jgi:hypothetical protein